MVGAHGSHILSYIDRDGNTEQATWGQTLQAVYTFSTVEDFC